MKIAALITQTSPARQSSSGRKLLSRISSHISCRLVVLFTTEPKQNHTKIEIQKGVRTSPTQDKKGPTRNHHSFFQGQPIGHGVGKWAASVFFLLEKWHWCSSYECLQYSNFQLALKARTFWYYSLKLYYIYRSSLQQLIDFF